MKILNNPDGVGRFRFPKIMLIKFFRSVMAQKKKIESILNLMILKISFQSFDELIGEYGYITSKDDVLFFYSTENAPNGKVSALTIKNGSYVWNDVISESDFDNSFRQYSQ